MSSLASIASIANNLNFHFFSACVYTSELLSWRWRTSSVVLETHFIRKCEANQREILWKVAIHRSSIFSVFQIFLFWNFFFDFFSFSLTWDPMEVKNFKTLLLSTVINLFQPILSWNFLWQSSEKLLLDILKFWISKFSKKIEIFVNMGPYGSENFITLPLLQLLLFCNQTSSECSL